ncbi:MAG: Uma2 family endonuclease [Saprospiraceae bacterium]
MVNTSQLIDELQHQPDFPAAVEELQKRLEQERSRRQEYYALLHEDVKAEFINGEIIYQSPVKRKHWKVSIRLSTLLHNYVETNQLGEVGVEKVMVSLSRNDYEPDIVFFSNEKAGGFQPDQMHFPAPDFVVEIVSESTESRDRGVKFDDYAVHGVQEYWIIDPEERSIEQYLLQGKVFELYQKLTGAGLLKSTAIRDFTVEISSLF